MALANKVQLMWNCSLSLEPTTHTHKLLKSFYMNMCRKLASNTVQMPKEKISTSQMCSHCGCFWSESEFSMKLRPQQVAHKSKTKSLIEKLEKSKETGQRGLLSRKQRKRAKWLQKRAHNYVQMKCEQCRHKSFIEMEKPKAKKKMGKNDQELQIVKVMEAESVVETKTKKKKKNKNKKTTAGLKIPLPSDKKQLTITIDKATKASTKPSQISASSSGVTKINIKKAKSKIKQKSTTGVKSSHTNKVLSKTQKQNSLLQLAALLKQQTTAAAGDGKSSAQKRLEALLK